VSARITRNRLRMARTGRIAIPVVRRLRQIARLTTTAPGLTPSRARIGRTPEIGLTAPGMSAQRSRVPSARAPKPGHHVLRRLLGPTVPRDTAPIIVPLMGNS